MEVTRQQVIDDIIHDAHFRAPEAITSEVVAEIVDELHGLEAAGHDWVADYLDTLAAKGAAKVYADWRRRYTIDTTTRKGTGVTVPGFGSVLKRDDEGQVVYTQMRLLDMTLPQLIERRGRLAKTRDTLSIEVRLLSDLIEAMEADASLVTARDAIARVEEAA